MSHRLTVLLAIAALIDRAVPTARVEGLDNDTPAPRRPTGEGRVIVRAGDPGDPDVDLSPRRYNWTHRVPIEIIGLTEAQVDAMMMAIGDAIEADRFLGGLCDWIEPEAPMTDDITADDAKAARGAAFAIVASYATDSPLG